MNELDDGHEYDWIRSKYDENGEISDAGQLIGLTQRHPTPHGQCSTMAFWAEHSGIAPTHQLLDGGPDDLGNVTVSPAIVCTLCGTVGKISRGTWITETEPFS